MTATTKPKEPAMRPRTWLVAHDFSACADAAAALALEDLLDSRAGGRLVLAHVFTVLTPQGMIEPVPMGGYYLSLEQASRTEATRALERVAVRLRALQQERFNGPPPVEIEVAVRMGAPAEGILDEAAQRGVERIVVGTHGRKGVAHLVLGSIAERIVRLANVPVLVAHAREGQ